MKFLKMFDFTWLTHSVKKTLLIFLVGFCVYPTIEIVWNTILTPFGYKTFAGLFSMGILGGVLLVLLGNLNEIKVIREVLPGWVQAIVGGLIITILEFIFGLVLNIGLGWKVWDYSSLPFNFMGQICLLYSVFWTILSPLAFWLDDIFRVAYERMVGKFNANMYEVPVKCGYARVSVGTPEDLKHRYKRFFKRNLYAN